MKTTLTGLGFTLALVLGGLTSAASAQTAPTPPAALAPGHVVQPTEHVATEQRQRAEWQAIQDAIASGRIDRREAARLTRMMEGIQRYQERSYADGVLTLREQAHLARAQTRLERDLARASRR